MSESEEHKDPYEELNTKENREESKFILSYL